MGNSFYLHYDKPSLIRACCVCLGRGCWVGVTIIVSGLLKFLPLLCNEIMVTMVTMGGDLQPGCLADRLLTGLGQPRINP